MRIQQKRIYQLVKQTIMKKKIYLALAVFGTAMSTSAQKVKWNNPYTGYSNTQNLAISFIAMRSLLR